MRIQDCLFGLSLCLGLVACGTTTTLLTPPVQPPPSRNIQVQNTNPPAQLRFPEDWQGQWKGQCQALGLNNTQTFAPFEMRLTVKARSPKTWQWKIEYINAQMHQNRDYELQEIDKAKGHYAVDENNGIVLDTFKVTENLIFEQFSIGQSMIIGKHEITGPQTMTVELTTFGTQPIRKSGGGQNTVHSFPLRSHQVCQLSRSE